MHYLEKNMDWVFIKYINVEVIKESMKVRVKIDICITLNETYTHYIIVYQLSKLKMSNKTQ